MVEEAYIQEQCSILGCTKTEYLHDIAMAQIHLVYSCIIIFGLISLLCLVLIALGIIFTKSKNDCLEEFVSVIFIVVGVVGFIIMGVSCCINVSDYFCMVDNPNMAALHWIDTHINIISN